MTRALGHATQVREATARPVSQRHDAEEREAERAADVVAHGGSVAGWTFAAVPASAHVQRQEAVKEKRDEEKRNEALKKTGEAALATPEGKALKEKVLQDPVVKAVTDAVTSTPGLIVTGAAIAGGVTALGATGRPLPFQPPEIPLEKLSPKLAGVSAKVTYEGPVNAPTFVGLTITVKEQGPKDKGKKVDPIAADIARLRAQEEMFRRGRTYTPGSKEAEEERLLDQAVQNYVLRGTTLPGLTIPLTPPAKKEEQTTPAQPAPASPSAAPPASAPLDDALSAPGRPLDPPARRAMEARFGYDFSDVRLHDDVRAAASAASIDAAAFTVGGDIVFGPGRYDPAGVEGRRLLAHELAHVVQQRRGSERPVQRAPQAGAATMPAVRRDYEEFVDGAVRYLDSARDHYRTLTQNAAVPGPPRPAAQLEQRAADGRQSTSAGPARGPEQPSQVGSAAAGATPAAVAVQPPALAPDRLHTVLDGLLRTYEASRSIIVGQLDGDPQRSDRLAAAYQGAVDAARAAAAGMGRVNLVFIAAPREDNDLFIVNATTYARLYFSTPAAGDTVHLQEQIDSPDALFDAIESTEPDRMIRRIDIFCHGTIEPTHQIKFGRTWFRVDQIQAAASARARSGRTLQNQTRFDGSTVIELHACRLGAPAGQPGRTGMAVTRGDEFLRGFGESVGGNRGEQVTGYVQRWVPRRFAIPGIRSTRDLTGARARAFDRIAVRTFDAVMVGSVELQSQLTEAERAGGAISEARKIAVMRRLYDAGGGAWLIGHQYSTATPRSADPVRDRPRARDTFTNERDWTHLVLNVRLPVASRGTP